MKITFKTDNAAFTDNESIEVARILRELADRIENGEQYGKVMDVNGNSIGTWTL